MDNPLILVYLAALAFILGMGLSVLLKKDKCCHCESENLEENSYGIFCLDCKRRHAKF